MTNYGPHLYKISRGYYALYLVEDHELPIFFNEILDGSCTKSYEIY